MIDLLNPPVDLFGRDRRISQGGFHITQDGMRSGMEITGEDNVIDSILVFQDNGPNQAGYGFDCYRRFGIPPLSPIRGTP